MKNRQHPEFGSSTNSQKSFMGSSTRLWNVAPQEIKKSAWFHLSKENHQGLLLNSASITVCIYIHISK
jgi:hypothetical protein